MEKFTFSFESNNQLCSATVELIGYRDSWNGKAQIIGHPKISELNINYRLGDYLSPLFVREEDLIFFKPMIYEITNRATKLLPEYL